MNRVRAKSESASWYRTAVVGNPAHVCQVLQQAEKLMKSAVLASMILNLSAVNQQTLYLPEALRCEQIMVNELIASRIAVSTSASLFWLASISLSESVQSRRTSEVDPPKS